MIIRPLNGISPKIGKNVFIADNAVIIGDVTIGDNCSIWFNTVLRGDVNRIVIGNNTNIQDGVIIHCTYKYSETIIGNDVTVGHGAILHGCHIADKVLIGMGAIVLDLARVGSYCVIGANSLVLEKQVLEPNSLYAGSPAAFIKPISEKLMNVIDKSATNYLMYADWYRK